MPYYDWSSIDLMGGMHKGRLFARNEQELDAILLKREMALIHYKQVKSFVLFNSVQLQHKIEFFKQMAHMLQAGVLVPDALTIVGSQMHHTFFQNIISQITQLIYQGTSLHQALAQYPKIFDVMMVHMIQVGQESGKLAQAFSMLADYLENQYTFKKKLRSVLVVPVITFAFFCTVGFIIFMFIIPQFVSMFQSIKQELPFITRIMLRASSAVSSGYALSALFLLILIIMLIFFWMRLGRGKYYADTLVLKIPYVNRLVVQASLSYFMQGFSMLLQGGVTFVQAMSLAKQTIHNDQIKNYVSDIHKNVVEGYSLSQALLHDHVQLFTPDIISIIRVAEESGQMGLLLGHAASIYQSNVNKSITFFTTIINPLLMLVLGLLITFLIFAVYLPIFNMSAVIGV